MKKYFFLLFFLISTEFLYSQINLSQGLIAYFPFDGNANDVSGNGLSGVVLNATLTTDKDGNTNSTYYFNGSNSSILLPFSSLYDFNPQDSFSISIWVLPDLGSSWSAQALVVKSPSNADYNASNWNYGVYLSNYKAMTGYAKNNFLNGVTTLNNNNPCWYNIIETYKNGIWNLYVNGVLEAFDSSQTKFILKDGISRIAMGKKGESSGDYYKGKMDEVRIYNRVLNASEINAIVGNCNTKFSCNNWLRTINPSDAVQIGDLDVSGNQLTVEAVFNRTTPYTRRYIYAGDIVSKHNTPQDCNYLLRPNDAEITTTNGFYQTPEICDIGLNKTYQVAMTYDGSYLKFYRNGFLMSQIPATGNLIQNNSPTTIGSTAITTNFFENMNGFINEVRIWNVARTQDEIKTYMNTSLPNPTTQSGLLAYYTFDTLINKQGNASWNGILTGDALINQTNTSCNFTADSCIAVPCTSKNDFSFNLNPCSPQSVSFKTNATDYNSILWSFGDGNTASNTVSPSNTYSNFGNYMVTMITDYIYCSDTTTKNITVYVQDDSELISTNDTTICSSSSMQLHSVSGLNFCWTPSDYLDNPNLPNPTTSTPKPITYYLQSLVTGNNLIINGDFSLGNTGFTSQYTYADLNITEGQYFVGANANSWNLGMATCGDHTTGSGNVLMVNGSPAADAAVWKQTVPVTPNTNYAFSTWIEALSTPNPAQLMFSINGVDVGNTITASLPTCTWGQFYTTWNSGSSNSATISIVNENTIRNGNDFALDDISFAPVTIRRDSVKINVDTIPKISLGNDTTLCEGQTLLLNATNNNASYLWQDGSTLPTYTVTTQGTYTVKVSSPKGCDTTGRINVDYITKPVIDLGKDTTLCLTTNLVLNATYPNSSYLWQDGSTQSTYDVTQAGLYKVEVTNYCGNVTDSINIQYDDCSCKFYIPSAFTPNGDSRNDIFKPSYNCFFSNYLFRIFNRWGHIIFSTENPSEGWDGKVNAINQPSGTYIWELNYFDTLLKQEVKKNGTVVLIR